MMMGFFFWVLLLLGGLLFVFGLGDTSLMRRGKAGLGLDEEKEEPTAKQLLDERLARGEISEEEYDEILTRIQQ